MAKREECVDFRYGFIVFVSLGFVSLSTSLNLSVGKFQEIKHIMKLEDRRICYQDFQDVNYEANADIGLTIDQLLTKYGYPVERINVTTEDGYILGVYRIPYSPKSPLVEGEIRPAVYINHGLGSTGLCWFVQPMSRNLPTLLADNGFDVFIGNARGNSYSQGHTNPNMTTSSRKYWDFSFHEMGVKDVPAVIDMITKVTGNWKMYYIGHSMGAAEIAVTLSERPEYNSRMATVFMLAPSIYVGHTIEGLVRMSRYANYYQYGLNFVLRGKIETYQVIQKYAGKSAGNLCSEVADTCGICSDFLFSQGGYDAPQMNYTSLGIFLESYPDTVSTKSLTHYMQHFKTDEFCQFNYGFSSKNYLRYGQSTPPCYNLGKISAPVVIFYGQNDVACVPQDVAKTASKIPSLKEFNKVTWPLFTHLDVCIAKDADILVYNPVMDIMKNKTYG